MIHHFSYAKFTVALIIALAAHLSSAFADQPRPNIILCMADDMGWGDTGFNGHAFMKTPNLDALASTGIKFDRFYSAAPVCSPTRGSCLTGRHPFRYGIYTANRGHLKPQEICLAELLKEHGYATGHFGKWHLGTLTTKIKDANRGKPGNTKDYSPPWDHGFDVCFSTESKVPTFNPMKNPEAVSKANKKGVEVGGPYGTYYWTGPDQRVPDDELVGDDSMLIVKQATKFIEQQASDDKPFFAVIWFHAPHLPVVADEAHRGLYPNHPRGLFGQHYAGCISAIDDSIGALNTTLKDAGVADNTMLWFCSDNGPEGNEKSPGSAGQFRGRKRSLYEGGVRVPGFLVWPEQIKSPRQTDFPCVTSDYFPTIVDALGLPLKSDRPMDGISLMPMIQGKVTLRNRPIGFQSGNTATWCDDQFKLVHSSSRNASGGQEKVQLFDLSDDPGESSNIADKHPEIVDKMHKQLIDWQKSCKRSDTGEDYK